MHALIKQSLWYPQKCLITVADHWVPGIVVGAIETKHVLQLHLYQWNKEIAILPVSPLYTSHSTIGRYETPSLHTTIEMLIGKPG